AVELALASYPGFHPTAPPGRARPYGVYTAAYVSASEVAHTVVLPDRSQRHVPAPDETVPLAELDEPTLPQPLPAGPTQRVPLGTVAGARSGDKGGSANLGVWVRSAEAYRWLAHTLTVGLLQSLLPETAQLPVYRYAFPNLLAVNFVIDGLLGEGVGSQARFDPQAKALGEWLRARYVDVPEVLL